MRVLKHNVRVVDPVGEKVVLFGGDLLPEWAEGQVAECLVRDDGVVPEPVVARVEAFGIPLPEDEGDDDVVAFGEGRWFGDSDAS